MWFDLVNGALNLTVGSVIGIVLVAPKRTHSIVREHILELNLTVGSVVGIVLVAPAFKEHIL